MIVFDTETTGLVGPLSLPLDKQPRLIEFAALKLDDDLNIIGSLEFLCNPGIKLPKIITKITGLTDAILEHELPFDRHYDTLKQFFTGEDEVVAHNVLFDVTILSFELKRIGKEDDFPMPINKKCTVKSSMPIAGYRLKLADLYFRLCGEKIKEAHRAMNDVNALFECVKVMRNKKMI